LLDTKKERSEYLAEILGKGDLSIDSIDELLRRKPDIVIEVASPRAEHAGEGISKVLDALGEKRSKLIIFLPNSIA